MHSNDPLLFRQLPVIQKIVADETWLEGERRGCPVSAKDPVVQENVCRVILRIGREMREAAQAAAERDAKTVAIGAIAAAEEHEQHAAA